MVAYRDHRDPRTDGGLDTRSTRSLLDHREPPLSFRGRIGRCLNGSAMPRYTGPPLQQNSPGQITARLQRDQDVAASRASGAR
jgi:hypothetical protein